jgi:N-acetyl-anhydromuramyl-L-alanine amidase AmpD
MARNRPQFIVWHTAAHGYDGVDFDTTAAQIDSWHRERGWAGIGYHYVVRKDGTIERGRPESRAGAHVRGLNGRSIGICFSGHGDIAPHTLKQRAAGLTLTRQLMEKYDIPPEKVIGHREVNDLIERGELARRYRVYKTCPGRWVDMEEVRRALRGKRPPEIAVVSYDREVAERLLQHLQGLYVAVKALGLQEVAYDELNAFRREPHIDYVIERFKRAKESEAAEAEDESG